MEKCLVGCWNCDFEKTKDLNPNGAPEEINEKNETSRLLHTSLARVPMREKHSLEQPQMRYKTIMLSKYNLH